MARPPPRPIKRLLVCNRGEIATRVISAANELDIPTYAVYTSNDTSHVLYATHEIELPSPASYLDIPHLISLIKSHGIDAVHPGYGFLSESAEFSRRVWEEAGAVVVGPGWEILEKTGDKLRARALAEECSVPVTPALQTPTNDISTIRAFADRIGYPVMIKAVDGGGGRGIRLVQQASELESLATRAIEESPSRLVYAEKAAVDGFRHIEVQIVGDGEGGVRHLWERECSIQRRWQKVIEVAPSTIRDRGLVEKVIEAAVRMAEKVNYFSLGTFEFLVSPRTSHFYFLEINPRLQVEHTITESLTSTDLVQTQLLLSTGHPLPSLPLPPPTAPLPPLHSIQLRLTAESPAASWTLTTGALTLHLPTPNGPGLRIDTHAPTTVSTDFDALLAKLVATAPSWPAAVRKARRALAETAVASATVKTNLAVLRAVVAHPDFAAGACDTRWLEGAAGQGLVAQGDAIGRALAARATAGVGGGAADGAADGVGAAAGTLFRRGDAWAVALEERGGGGEKAPARTHHLELERVLRNDFPGELAAEVVWSSGAEEGVAPRRTPFVLRVKATAASSGAALSRRRRGDPGDPTHVCIPFAGKVVEVLVEEGDAVAEGDVLCVVQQMKMELEVRSARAGRVVWAFEGEEGEEVAEGTLACVLELEGVGTEKARL